MRKTNRRASAFGLLMMASDTKVSGTMENTTGQARWSCLTVPSIRACGRSASQAEWGSASIQMAASMMGTGSTESMKASANGSWKMGPPLKANLLTIKRRDRARRSCLMGLSMRESGTEGKF